MACRFSLGENVIVRHIDTHSHVRTPTYVRGKSGIVVATLGTYRNPEQLAYGADGLPMLPLYRIRFRQTDLWPNYDGQPQDSAVVEIFEPWLETA
jgi:nitrile hydratase